MKLTAYTNPALNTLEYTIVFEGEDLELMIDMPPIMTPQSMIHEKLYQIAYMAEQISKRQTKPPRPENDKNRNQSPHP